MSYLAKEKVVSRNNPSIFPQETIYKNYFRIQLKPEQFSSYLTSPEVGFSSYELVATPSNTSRGKHGWEGLVLDARVLRCGEPQGLPTCLCLPCRLPASSVLVPQGSVPQPLSGLLTEKLWRGCPCCS